MMTRHCAAIASSLIGMLGCTESTSPGETAGGHSTSNSSSSAFGGNKSSGSKSSATSAANGGNTNAIGTPSNGGGSGRATTVSGGFMSTGGALSSGSSSRSSGAVIGGSSSSNAASGGTSSGAAAGQAGAGVGAGNNTAGTTGSDSTHHVTCPAPAGAEMTEASVPSGYCAWRFAEGLDDPRGLISDAQGQLLVVERGRNQVTLLWDENGDRINQPSERMQLASATGLNHGIALHQGYLYASTATTVYRWLYDGSRKALTDRQTVLTGMPSGGHSTRTLVFDGEGNLYIAIGSGSNLDDDSTRARVVRLDTAKVSATGANLSDTTVHADGTRNECGLRFDSRGRLWGVENGSDDLNRSDLGGDIHNDNPAEEVNLLNQPGAFYGYPYCWSEGNLAANAGGLGPGTQWAYPSAMNDGVHTDAWCRNTANVKPPVLTLQAHTAPLDILFYQGGSFPADVKGSAIVTYHGSWNRTPATGYKVVLIPFGQDGMPNGVVTSLLESKASGDTGGGWTHRPVALAQGKSGEVYITSDEDGLVMALGHD